MHHLLPAAAIKASLADTLAKNDDTDEGSDLETFTDEDSNTNTSFDLKRKIRVQNGASSTQQNGASSFAGINGEGGEKEKNGTSSNGRLPSPEDKDPSWETFLGQSEEKSTLLIRWPDGSRDSWSQPADSQLRALLLFVASSGYSPHNYEVVTNFPRKQIDSLQPDLTLKCAGLFPRETVFVQLKDN